MTPAQVARARYDEAHQIRDAWEHRLRVAQLEHNHAAKNGGDELATRRNLNAAQLQADDALEAMRLAHHLWVEAARGQAWGKVA